MKHEHSLSRRSSMRSMSLAAILALSASGCGYNFQGATSTLPSDVRRIYIPQVENNSSESGFGPLLTESLRDQFDKFGAVAVVDTRAEADAVLQAAVIKVKRSTRTTTGSTDQALQYDTTVTVASDLKKTNGTTLWIDPGMVVTNGFGGTASSVVDTSADFNEGTLSSAGLAGLSDQEVLRSQQSRALRSVASEVSRRIYNSAVVGDF